MDPDILKLILLSAGLLVGFLIGWLIARLRLEGSVRARFDKEYVPKQSYLTLEAQMDGIREDLREKETELVDREKELAAVRARLEHLQEKLDHQAEELKQWTKRSTASFENLANKIFTEKSDRFRHQSQAQLEEMLKPLRERIREFTVDIDRKFSEDSKQKHSLRLAIDQLKDLNSRLSDDANRLASALKGRQQGTRRLGGIPIGNAIGESWLAKGYPLPGATELQR